MENILRRIVSVVDRIRSRGLYHGKSSSFRPDTYSGYDELPHNTEIP